MYSYGPPHMAEQKQDDQLEHTYSSSVRIRDVALKTCQRRWTIGRSGEIGSGISVLAARHDDNDDFLGRILVRTFTTCQTLAQFLVDHPSCPAMPSVVLVCCILLCNEPFNPCRLHLSFISGLSFLSVICFFIRLMCIIIIIIILLFEFFPPVLTGGFLTGVWVTASLLKFPGIFLVFWSISTML